jgi:hypothetical protein
MKDMKLERRCFRTFMGIAMSRTQYRVELYHLETYGQWKFRLVARNSRWTHIARSHIEMPVMAREIFYKQSWCLLEAVQGDERN